jgi:hypothetical protein
MEAKEMKFKVGDRVRILSGGYDTEGYQNGDTITIDVVDANPCVLFPFWANNYGFDANELAPVAEPGKAKMSECSLFVDPNMSNEVRWHDGSVTLQNETEARLLVEAVKSDVEAAFAAGLEAGKAQAATKPAEPAPLVLTDVEKAFWATVYGACAAASEGGDCRWAQAQADVAIAALRARSAAEQEPVELDQAQARIAELETQLAACRQGAEINRAEGVKAERERCAGIARKFLDASTESLNIARGPNGKDLYGRLADVARSILIAILNPTK